LLNEWTFFWKRGEAICSRSRGLELDAVNRNGSALNEFLARKVHIPFFFHSKYFGVMKSWSQRNSRAKSPKSFSSVPWNSHVGCSRRNGRNPVHAPTRVWTTDPITYLAGQ
jgi:hypothetical protein